MSFFTHNLYQIICEKIPDPFIEHVICDISEKFDDKVHDHNDEDVVSLLTELLGMFEHYGIAKIHLYCHTIDGKVKFDTCLKNDENEDTSKICDLINNFYNNHNKKSRR